MEPERVARVWMWLSIYHSLEAEDRQYGWPPDPDDNAAAEQSFARSRACEARAERVLPGSTKTRWADAFESFTDPNFRPQQQRSSEALVKKLHDAAAASLGDKPEGAANGWVSRVDVPAFGEPDGGLGNRGVVRRPRKEEQ